MTVKIVNSEHAVTALRLTKPTALDWMRDLNATGIVELTPGDSNTSQPAAITLAEDWKWLLDGTSLSAQRHTPL